jgi:hypothetical protein
MNVKVFTPKQMLSGSGMSTVKQILLSIVATTISIILTFGTASWLEKSKNDSAKREMVMMILYDLAGTLEKVESADSLIREFCHKQVAVAENPQLLEQDPFMFIEVIEIDYTETVEHIFSTSIETINTIGNVFFAEKVAEFYQLRKNYQENISDKYIKEVKMKEGMDDYDKVISTDFLSYYLFSSILLNRMKDNLEQCQQMMEVSDEDLNDYRQMRQNKTSASFADKHKAFFEDVKKKRSLLNEAIKKGKERQ